MRAASMTNSRSAVPELTRKEKTEFNKLQKRLRRNVGNAIADYNMIEQGDKVMVCLSGGKDSYGMLDILLNLRNSAPVDFELVAVNLDQKQPGFPEEVLPAYLSGLDIPFYILEKDTYSIVQEVVPEGKTTCGLCSRLRRGSLYGFAQELGANKIALGHHRDDIIETFFLNICFAGNISTMVPRQDLFDGRLALIRPLAFLDKTDIIALAAELQFEPVRTNCPLSEKTKRMEIRQLLSEMYERIPVSKMRIFSALSNVRQDYLLKSPGSENKVKRD